MSSSCNISTRKYCKRQAEKGRPHYPPQNAGDRSGSGTDTYSGLRPVCSLFVQLNSRLLNIPINNSMRPNSTNYFSQVLNKCVHIYFVLQLSINILSGYADLFLKGQSQVERGVIWMSFMINKKASEKNYQIFKKNIFLNTQERICNQILAK